jgi:hypothetical protein
MVRFLLSSSAPFTHSNQQTMTYETEFLTANNADAERQYFSDYYQEAEEEYGDDNSTYFDTYSTFDADDYEYQQDLAMMY